ncbi:hypothetical protein [uncultured Thiodictyon sp.]|uniref:hypothetical protein n=1 Tax=uncultured Thiodictyon sp. TaxID=1846217 RepID=UPI0025CC72EB|nr:hypothetical protein [uncultured Thiodictyon sp.]
MRQIVARDAPVLHVVGPGGLSRERAGAESAPAYRSCVGNRALGSNQLDSLSAAPEPGGLFAARPLVLAGRRLAARRAARSAVA